MRRIPIYFSDDILMQEVVAMARDHGFHVRHINGMTVVDRVPGIVRRDPPVVVVPIKRGKK